MADNVDYQQRGGLRLDDAMAIHAALHTPSVHEVRISTGDLLPIESNEQGVRRCIIGRESARPKGRGREAPRGRDVSSIGRRPRRAPSGDRST